MKSPTKRAGKTRAVTLLASLAPRALPTSNITAASVFRTIEAFTPTLLADEADSFLRFNEDLRGVLNSGHTRPLAKVVRTVGEEHEPRCFSTWCPKVIALIGHLPDTLEDRSIIINMKRKAKDEKVARMRLSKIGKELEPLRSKAARWTKDNIGRLRDAEPPVPEQLNDRAADNWEPLVAIADLCGGTWPEEARKAALALSGSTDEVETHSGIQLLADLRDLFDEHQTDRLASKRVVEALTAMEGRPWPEYRMGKPLTENQLAKILKPFEVRPKGIRLPDGKTPRGYLRADLEDSFSRYLASEPQQPQQVNVDGPSTQSADRNSEAAVAPPESGATPRQMALVAPVAPRERTVAEAETQGHVTSEEWGEV
jgi:putative DNA primase/helicase